MTSIVPAPTALEVAHKRLVEAEDALDKAYNAFFAAREAMNNRERDHIEALDAWLAEQKGTPR